MKKIYLTGIILSCLGLFFFFNGSADLTTRLAWGAGSDVNYKVDPFEDHCWKDVMDPEILEIYKAYKRPLYIGKRPAILAIDLYRSAFEGGPLPVSEVVKKYPSSCGVNAWNAVKPIQELLALARSQKIPIFYSTGDDRKQSKPGSTSVSATQRQVGATDARRYEIMDEFKPEPADAIIVKQRASAFFGSPLIAHLTQLGIDTVIVIGESTSGCVRASVADAYSYGFHVVVVENCCFDRSILNHKVNLFDMHHKYADVMNLEEVKSHLKKAK